MELSKETLQYWQEEDFSELEAAKEFADMFVVARRVLDRMPRPTGIVCGPVTTGGRGSLEANLELFAEKIQELQKNGAHIFDYTIFEIPMQRLKANLKPGEYPTGILDDFCMPLFKSGELSTFYFLPDWQTSKGATWEHDLAKELGKEIKYL